MSGFVCPLCKSESQIFRPTTGDAEGFAKETGIALLGKVPLDPRISQSADYGLNFLDEYPDSPTCVTYLDIIDSECCGRAMCSSFNAKTRDQTGSR